MREPVLVTGAGVVTPIGQDLDSFWAGLVTGVSGISEIERFSVQDLRVTRGGEVKKPRAGHEHGLTHERDDPRRRRS